jgi:acylphosphatase
MKATHLIITGRVQGVGFRDWLVVQATGLGVEGWVRNAGQDCVEALLAGDPGAVEECLRRCRLGPPGAAVTSITDNIASPPAEPGFIKRASLASLSSEPSAKPSETPE